MSRFNFSYTCLWIIAFFASCLPIVQGSGSTPSHRLFTRLFSQYNRHIRPVFNSSHLTIVEMDCSLRGVLGTDAVHQTIVVKEWLRMYWVDEFLQWKPEEFDGITEVKVPRSMIWLPDVTRIDLVSMVQAVEDDRSFVIIDHNGKVRHSIGQLLKVYCDYSIAMFPFDHQNCTIHYEPWHSTEKEVKLVVSQEPDISNYRPSTEWELVSYSSRTSTVLYGTILRDRTSRVFYDIVIRRRSIYYVVSFMLPCFIIMELSLLGLFSPTNDAGEHSEKVTMGLTSLLSMTVLLLMISENLPKTNQGLPLLGVFVLFEICIGALATATTVYVCHMQSGWRKGINVPLFLRYLETWSPLGKRIRSTRRISDGEVFAEQWRYSSSMQFGREGERRTGLFAQIGNFESNMRMISASLQKRNALDRHRLKWAAACEQLDRALLLLFLSTNTLFFVGILIVGYSA